MKRIAIACCLVTLAALPCSAASRTLSENVPATDLETVSLDAGVGDITVSAADSDTIEVEVVLTPRRGGIFTSMRRAQEDVDEAELRIDVDGHALRLDVASHSHDGRFEERWTIHMPARLSLDLDAGVGDVSVRGIGGGVDLELGVGDVLVEVPSGNLAVEAGVGDVTVRGRSDAYGRVECAGGVGDARLIVRGERIASEGMVGHSASWRGDGPSRLDVEAGVGDVSVRLD